MEGTKLEDRERRAFINGFRYMPGTTEEFVDGIRDFRLDGNEIFVTSFPKSGTLWLTEIIWQILHDGIIDETPIFERNVFIDISRLRDENITASEVVQRIKRFSGSNVIVTHYLPTSLPNILFEQASNDPISHCDADVDAKKEKGDIHSKQKETQSSCNHKDNQVTKGKVIYVMRNPWDVAVSFYHHLRSPTFSFSSLVSPDTTWDDFFELFIQGKLLCGTWFNHVIPWLEHRHQSNILFINFEDIKMDHAGAVKQIARFLDKDITDETTNKIVRQTTVDAMKNKKAFQNPRFQHVRKGVIGDWANYFTDEQNHRLQHMYDVRMAGTGLDSKK